MANRFCRRGRLTPVTGRGSLLSTSERGGPATLALSVLPRPAGTPSLQGLACPLGL